MAISQASVTYYADNNFDINNIPASPAVLASASTTGNLEVINCLPLSGKQSAQLTVKTWSKLNTTSYLKLHFEQDGFDWYGIVTGYEYVAMDRVVITITIDAWLTCGGTAGISEVSGITKRHHVLNDEFGGYCAPDPLISPRKPLLVTGSESVFNYKDGLLPSAVIVATIDLFALGDPTYSTAVTYTSDSGEVTVPIVPQIDSYSPIIKMYDSDGNVNYTKVPAVKFYGGGVQQVLAGISVARSLGIDDGIIGQYMIPEDFIESYTTNEDGSITNFEGIHEVKALTNDELNFIYDSSVKNKRVLYGENNKYVMIAIGSGNKCEYDPEDLYENAGSAPSVFCTCDLRQNGKPYFRFEYVNGNKSNWFVNSIEGLQWQNAPIKYEAASGAKLAKENFRNSIANSYTAELENQTLNRIGILTGNLSQGVSGSSITPTGATLNASNIFSAAANFATQNVAQDVAIDQFVRARNQEVGQFLSNTTVVAPEINFPRSESLRDFMGNGVFVYRLRYDDDDIKRIDKILNMFGYADVAPLTLDMFSNMMYYNYVEASNVKITTSINVPRTVKELCQLQISAGIRVWKRNPDDSLYEANNRP